MIAKMRALGIWVIRIGDDNMETLPKIDHLLDLRPMRFHWLHPYVLHDAKMHVGTNSGPSWMSQVLGTPTLVTNVTSIARNMISGNRHTIYIPKHLFVKGRKLNLRETLVDLEAYSEIDGKALQARGISYHENTPKEITLATLELLNQINSWPNFKEFRSIDLTIDAERKKAGAISFGKFAYSFFDVNPSYIELD
jgi:putative glycosyltransferase (TIGR04372 family)